MTAPANVLVTGGEYLGVLAAVRGLAAGGYRPWVSTNDGGGYAARSRAVRGVVNAPHDDDDAFVAALVDASERLALDVVLPGTERALTVLAARAHEFPRSVRLGVPEPARVARATSKVELGRLAAEAALEVPETVEADRADVVAAAEGLGFPVMVKPLRSDLRLADGSSVHRRPVRARDRRELEQALVELPDDTFLVQPYIDGRLAAVAGVAWEGAVHATVHQVAGRIWPTHGGGSSYAVTTPADPQVDAAARTLIESLGWSGIFQLQLLVARDRAYLIDLNPRIYGSLSLAIAAGANLPALWVDLLLGRRPRAAAYRTGVGYRYEQNDARALVALARTRPLDALRGALPRPRTVHAVLQLRDPGPALVTLAKARGWARRRYRRRARTSARPSDGRR